MTQQEVMSHKQKCRGSETLRIIHPMICGQSVASKQETQTECMMGLKLLLLTSLLAALEVALVVAGSRSMPGSPTDISRKDRGLWQAVLAAAASFNNRSNDAFLFKPSAIHRAQQQIVKGVEYIVELDMARTVCRKRDNNNNLSDCDLQPEGRLQQMFPCHVEVWVIPWQKTTRTLVLDCRT